MAAMSASMAADRAELAAVFHELIMQIGKCELQARLAAAKCELDAVRNTHTSATLMDGECCERLTTTTLTTQPITHHIMPTTTHTHMYCP